MKLNKNKEKESTSTMDPVVRLRRDVNIDAMAPPPPPPQAAGNKKQQGHKESYDDSGGSGLLCRLCKKSPTIGSMDAVSGGSLPVPSPRMFRTQFEVFKTFVANYYAKKVDLVICNDGRDTCILCLNSVRKVWELHVEIETIVKEMNEVVVKMGIAGNTDDRGEQSGCVDALIGLCQKKQGVTTTTAKPYASLVPEPVGVDNKAATATEVTSVVVDDTLRLIIYPAVAVQTSVTELAVNDLQSQGDAGQMFNPTDDVKVEEEEEMALNINSNNSIDQVIIEPDDMDDANGSTPENVKLRRSSRTTTCKRILRRLNDDENGSGDGDLNGRAKRNKYSSTPDTAAKTPSSLPLTVDADDDHHDWESDDSPGSKPSDSTKGAKNSSLPCNECPHCHKTVCRLSFHIATHHKDKLDEGTKDKLTCSVCSRTFSHIKSRICHEINCCGVSYEGGLEEYCKKHKVILKTCTEDGCSMVFKTDTHLKKHMNGHRGLKPKPTPVPIYMCDICGQSFKYKPILKFHQVRVHHDKLPEEEWRSFACTICGKVFATVAFRVAHEMNLCKVTYSDEALKEMGVFLRRCEESGCGMVFGNLKRFKLHSLIHSRQGRYKCSYCDLSFVYMETKVNHEKTVCRPDPSYVPRHQRPGRKERMAESHKKKVFHCPHAPSCRSRFESKAGLGWHLKRVHPSEEDPSVTCEVCGKRMNASVLNRHMDCAHIKDNTGRKRQKKSQD